MIVAVDLEQLANLALAEAGLHEPRTPGRRAAAHLWVALTVPAVVASADAARRVIASFGDERTQSDALDLLGRLAAAVLATTTEE